MRLIDADVLYERLKTDEELAMNRVIDTPLSLPTNSPINPSAIQFMTQLSEITRFKEMVYDTPTVDAVEVIRCKDCKYSRMTFDGECKYCDVWFPDEKTYMDGNYFCASAERREDER